MDALLKYVARGTAHGMQTILKTALAALSLYSRFQILILCILCRERQKTLSTSSKRANSPSQKENNVKKVMSRPPHSSTLISWRKPSDLVRCPAPDATIHRILSVSKHMTKLRYPDQHAQRPSSSFRFLYFRTLLLACRGPHNAQTAITETLAGQDERRPYVGCNERRQGERLLDRDCRLFFFLRGF